ncbi:MAG: hypothetical protein IKG21_12090 [Atopobiaceae bacterium]|nr:hypothetical protein [Atopobiaceae bacterium]
MADEEPITASQEASTLPDSTYDEVATPLESRAFGESFDAVQEGSQGQREEFLADLPQINCGSDYDEKGRALIAVCRKLASTSYQSALSSPDLDAMVEYLNRLYGGEGRLFADSLASVSRRQVTAGVHNLPSIAT